MKIGVVIPILRQILQVLSGVLMTYGYIDEDGAQALTGLILNGVTMGWWLYDRWKINRHNRELKIAAQIGGHDG